MVGDQRRHEGTVRAQVIKANIPVRNGVIHLIKRPLLEIDDNLMHLVEENVDVSKFMEFLSRYAPATLNKIRQAKQNTLLAPSNAAFERIGKNTYNNLITDQARVEHIASLHFLSRKFAIRDALNISHSIKEVRTIQEPCRQALLYFFFTFISITSTSLYLKSLKDSSA
jgi:uncharacterized surface protein with fasciclin (FAS1) repeats